MINTYMEYDMVEMVQKKKKERTTSNWKWNMRKKNVQNYQYLNTFID